VIPQGQLGIPEAEEPHCTFVENALAKARHAAARGLPALADDSGLCVAALAARPASLARYAGEPKSDARNNEKLLADLAGKPTARPTSTACWSWCAADDPQPIIAEGEWHGEILPNAGEGGFGYDPLFFVPDSARPPPKSMPKPRTGYRTAAGPCRN
jgi:XTP/dITP diphosphohydrolase